MSVLMVNYIDYIGESLLDFYILESALKYSSNPKHSFEQI